MPLEGSGLYSGSPVVKAKKDTTSNASGLSCDPEGCAWMFDGSDWSFLTPSVQGNSQPSHSVSDLNSNISLAEDWENHPLLHSTQGTTQQDPLSTSDLQDSNSANLQYDDDDLLEVSTSFDYDWQLTGHCFIGEPVFVLYPNGLVGTVQKYSPPDGDDVALFHLCVSKISILIIYSMMMMIL